ARTGRAAARRASFRRGARGPAMPCIRWGRWCSFPEAVEAEALVLVARAADVGELGPAGAGRVELVLRVSLHEQKRALPRFAEVERARLNVAIVVERGALRHAQALLRNAGRADGDLRAQLQRDRTIALLVVGPRHPQRGERAPEQHDPGGPARDAARRRIASQEH